mmetsp:Transcript_39688/g.85830  ORF Transcript_39688/g.85830 Transcript_39688/m.85830 type:complete len:99 (+) Transcript_39688:1508-1804(+)
MAMQDVQDVHFYVHFYVQDALHQIALHFYVAHLTHPSDSESKDPPSPAFGSFQWQSTPRVALRMPLVAQPVPLELPPLRLAPLGKAAASPVVLEKPWN